MCGTRELVLAALLAGWQPPLRRRSRPLFVPWPLKKSDCGGTKFSGAKRGAPRVAGLVQPAAALREPVSNRRAKRGIPIPRVSGPRWGLATSPKARRLAAWQPNAPEPKTGVDDPRTPSNAPQGKGGLTGRGEAKEATEGHSRGGVRRVRGPRRQRGNALLSPSAGWGEPTRQLFLAMRQVGLLAARSGGRNSACRFGAWQATRQLRSLQRPSAPRSGVRLHF